MSEREEMRVAAERMWAVHRKTWQESNGTQMNEMLGMKVIQLNTTGRVSGEPRWVLLTCKEDARGWLVVASNLGADRDPNWWLNLKASGGEGSVTTGGETHAVRARSLKGEENRAAYDDFAATYDGYQKYREWTERHIPVVLLERVG